MSTETIDEASYLAHLQELYRRAWPTGAPTRPTWLHGEVPLTEYLRAWARERPQAAALVYYGHELDYASLDRQSDRMAALLRAHGVAAGDRVAVLLQNSPQFSIAFFGILKAGAVYVPISPMSRAFELEHVLTDTDAVAIVCQDQLLALVREVQARGQVKALRTIFATSIAEILPAEPSIPVPDSLRAPRLDPGDAIDLLPALEAIARDGEPAALPAPDIDALAALNYTGGTTGLPKGCEHTQRDMVYTAAANYGLASDAATTQVILSFFPQFWIAGQNVGLVMPVFAGNTLVLLGRWDAEGVLAAIERYRVNLVAMPVDGALELMDHPRFGSYDLSSLAHVRVVSFVKKLNRDYRARWRELTGTVMVEASWGMTETHTSDTFTVGFQEDDFDLTVQPIFVGLPVPGTEFRICDFDTGALVPLGAEGEIQVRTPSLLKGYWRNPQASAEAIVDGWLRTGDIGVIDTEGFLHYLGRHKEMLKVKGMSVFPPELEAVLGRHPDVVGSGVIGRPDPDKGEVPVAFVLVRDGVDRGAAHADITRWCRECLAAYKVPEVRIVDSLPMTATGKVRKQDLPALLAAPTQSSAG